MVFGDGSRQSGWNTPTNFLDIMGHELIHGVINKTANLQYRRQSGAILIIWQCLSLFSNFNIRINICNSWISF